MWENIERHTKKLLDEKFKEICKYCQAKDWQCVWNLVKSVAAHSRMFWKHFNQYCLKKYVRNALIKKKPNQIYLSVQIYHISHPPFCKTCSTSESFWHAKK